MKKPKESFDEFTKAYMDYYPEVFSSIVNKVSNIDDARDICQEVFSIFYDKINTIENKRSWLYGTLKNVVYQYYDKKSTDVNFDDITNKMGPSFVNGSREARIILNEAIDFIQCTGEERIIIDLISIYGFTYGEVAEILGLTRRQVEYKYAQLVKSLLEYLRSKNIKGISDIL